MSTLSRRRFFAGTGVAFAGIAAPAPAARAMVAWIDGGLPDGFPSQDPADVRAVVGKSHTDYDAVRELLTTWPELAKAAIDWGFGDWESALGAASHMGRRDIAELLMDHGARPDLFTFAMLDQVDVIRALCEANPAIQGLPGPHGLTLLHHARAGSAARVLEYLERLGGADVSPPRVDLDAASTGLYAGDYVPDAAPDVVFRIGVHRTGAVTFQRVGGMSARMLQYLGDHGFSPNGAPSVRIVFEVRDGAAAALAVHAGGRVVTATRQG